MSYTVDEPKLKEVFRLAGKVVSVDLNRDKNGKSRGFGVVEYNHPVEAVQAISMFNEQLLFDRRMTVRFDNQAPEEKDDVLPSRMPEGLGGVGMGLGSGGNPLTDVTRNLPSLSSNNEGGSGNSNMSAANTMNLDFMSNVAKLVNTMGFLSNTPGNNGNNNMGVGNPSGNNMGGNMGGGNIGGGNMGGGMGGNSNNMGMNMGGGNNIEPRNIGGYSSGNGGYPSNNGDGVRMGGGGMMNDGRVDMVGAPGGVQSRNSDSIIIRNLPVDCNWQALRDGFSHCGDIKYAEMKDRTIGLIRFTSERDAERAVCKFKHVSYLYIFTRSKNCWLIS